MDSRTVIFKSKLLICLFSVVSLLNICVYAQAPASQQTGSNWPNRPIKVVVPALTGGPDTLIRVLSPYLAAGLGQPIVVDNKPGASAVIGTDYVAKSAPDGYTFMADSSGFVVKPGIVKKLPYDTEKDFIPIINMASNMGLMLIVHPSHPAKNLGEFIAMGKKPETNFSYSSPGVGNTLHLLGELFLNQAGIKMTHVPYKGGAPAATAVVAGDVTTMLAPIQVSNSFLKAGKLRALAYTLGERTPFFPDVPTFKELGMTDFVTEGGWFGVFAPAGTSPVITNRMHVELKKALTLPEVREKLYGLGFLVVAESQEHFRNYFYAEIKKYAEIAKKSNIQAE